VNYVYSIVTVIAIYGLITLALNIQFGVAGLVNFGMVAYFAVGAYTYAIVTQPPPSIVDKYKYGLELSPWIGLGLGVLAAGLFAAVTSLPVLRLREDYLAIVTFAFAQVLASVMTNTSELGNGTLGLSNITMPASESMPSENYDMAFMIVSLAILAVVFVIVSRIDRSPFGDVLKASRDDELAALALGKRVYRFRLKVFVVGGAIAGLAGVVYVWYTTLISPGLISADVTFAAFIALVIGGLGSNWGAVIGAAIYFGLQEGLKLIPTSPDTAQFVSSIRIIPFGLALILVLRFRPQGLVGGWSPGWRASATRWVPRWRAATERAHGPSGE
jgi:branched-chain amino acid transport system permease protein